MGNISDLTKIIKVFCEERDWDQFHSPKDLAIGAVTESAELLEIFRFKSEEEVKKILFDPKGTQMVGDELSDVLFFILRFSQLYDIDLTEAFKSKMQKNALKYPVEEFKGKNHKSNKS